jgi:epoxyqueuosine reductase
MIFRMLVHVCCAGCLGAIAEKLMLEKTSFALYFYNPNIVPKEEYDKRKADVEKYAQKYSIPFFEGEYNQEHWQALITGYENEPERGKRCEICFEMRLKATAEFAINNGFKTFTTTLGISRWKPFEKICEIGNRVSSDSCRAGSNVLEFCDYNWRKKGGSEKMHEIAKKEGFYLQRYCGCGYSIDNK